MYMIIGTHIWMGLLLEVVCPFLLERVRLFCLYEGQLLLGKSRMWILLCMEA
jgi:hypothetical protein